MRIPYTYRMMSDAGFVIAEFECEVVPAISVPYPDADPIVRVEAVYMGQSHRINNGPLGTWLPVGPVDLLAQRDAFVRNLGCLIAAAASEDSDIIEAALRDEGTWQGIGPGERWVPGRAA